jgi:hypothetical protein
VVRHVPSARFRTVNRQPRPDSSSDPYDAEDPAVEELILEEELYAEEGLDGAVENG